MQNAKGGYIMNDYFYSIVKSTSLDELQILGYLFDQEATETFKAIPRRDVITHLNLTKTKAQNLLTVLESKKFIEVRREAHSHKLVINEFGQIALEESLKGADV